MTAQELNLPLSIFLIVILIFNVYQKRYLKLGENKKKAVLFFSWHVMFLWFSDVYIIKNNLSDYFLAVSFVIVLASLIIFHKHIFIFSLKCRVCGRIKPIKNILFYDEEICTACANGEITADEIDWSKFKPVETAVLVIIREKGQLLLIHKKTGLGTGKVNVPGGRIDKGEAPVQAAVRETEEEVGLTPHDLKEKAVLNFLFLNGYSIRGYVFYTEKYSGTIRETDEADPFWCPVSEIPYDKMWSDDILWFPKVLEGKNLKGSFIFREDQMLSSKIEIIE